MQSHRPIQRIESKIKEQQIVDEKGASYRIDRTSLIYRDSHMNAVYHCYKNHKDQNQNQLLCIKEYSQFTSKGQIMKEWDNLKTIRKLQLQTSYANFFMQFITTKAKRYYLIMKEFSQTLMDKHQFGCKNIKINSLNKKVNNFSRDISSLLLLLQKQANNKLILTTLKPHFLICNQKENFMLTNFSNALVAGSQQEATKFERIKGQGLYYYAPQMLQGKICAKSNVWIFGCILFQILCNGQKFIESQEYYNRTKDESLQQYIKKRIEYCQFRYNKLTEQTIQTQSFWLHLTQVCLQRDIRRRINIEELHKKIKNFQQRTGWLNIEQSSLQARILYQLSYQYYRANLLQSKIFAIFDQIYKMENNTDKYIIYIVIKFSAFIFLENYQLCKERAEALCKKKNEIKRKKTNNEKLFQERYSLFLSINEYKKIKEIKDKITQKIQKFMQIEQKQFQYHLSKKQQIQDETQKAKHPQIQNYQVMKDEQSIIYDKKRVREDIKKYFIQHQDRKVYDAQNILYAFCYKYAPLIQQNKAIYVHIAEILQYTKKLIDFDELVCNEIDLKSNIDALTLKMMYPFFNKCQKQAQTNPQQIFKNIYLNAQKANKLWLQRMNGIQKIC